MIEVQCTSCQTRYRIDERILPDETPTFKCSRCGHVFTIEPRKRTPARASAERAPTEDAGSAASPAEAQPPASAASDPGDKTPPQSEAASPTPIAQPPAEHADAAAAGASAPPPPRPRPAIRRAPRPPAASQGPQPAPDAPPSPDAAHDAGGEAAPTGVAPPERNEPGADAPAAEEHAPAASADPAARASSASAPGDADTPETGAERPAASRSPSPTEELARRPFESAPDDAARSRNFSFDFSDEMRASVSESARTDRGYREEAWQVGEPPSAPPPRRAVRVPRRIRAADIDDAREGHDFEQLSQEEASAVAARLEAALRGRSYTLHSAGFFIALFALVVFGFGVLSMVISGAPVASAELLSALPMIGANLEPPISPARRVALSQVEARYTRIKDKQTALVVSGVAENVSPATLGAVQIEAALMDPAQQALLVRAVYCGNNLSPAMVSEMTPHELEFFEKLDGPRNFSLAPQASAPFVIVFVSPPAGASRFQLRIAKAEPAAAAAPPATGD